MIAVRRRLTSGRGSSQAMPLGETRILEGQSQIYKINPNFFLAPPYDTAVLKLNKSILYSGVGGIKKVNVHFVSLALTGRLWTCDGP